MNELYEHPQIAELMDTLEQNGMGKEQEEVRSLVDYIGDMEKTLTDMLGEMRDMRQEINLIHNSSLKAKCQSLVQKTESKIKQGLAVVGRAKDNLIQSAVGAVKTFKEKGKEAFGKAIRTMKVPETLDKLAKLFGKLSKGVEQDVVQINAMQSELNSAKGHFKNIGRLLIGREAKEEEQNKSDKGVLSRVGKILGRVGKDYSGLSQKAMDTADKIRVSHVKESVKSELDTLKGIKNGRTVSDPFRDR